MHLAICLIDQVTGCIISFLPGAVQQAYRNIAVHPHDRPLLGMQWNGNVLVDKVLPFGLRSAPLLFSAVADALQWAIEKNGAKLVFHYVDNFITIGPPHSSACQESLSVIQSTCDQLGVPWKSTKATVPHPVLSFSAWNWTLELKPSASLKKNSQGYGYGWKNGGTARQLAREIHCRLLVTCNTHLKR